MNRSRRLAAGQIGLVFCAGLFGALTGCTSAQPQPPRAYVSPPPVEASVSVGYPMAQAPPLA
jgi:hypothetical protein